MYKIGICGAHGTGKTTIATLLAKELKLPFITNTMRSMWVESGVVDFEKLPSDVRSQFQKHAILKQINRENIEGLAGFITDRTVIDNLAYTKLSSNMDGVDLEIYKTLAIERIKNYSHFIYLPIMFEPEADSMRANLNSRQELAKIFEQSVLKYVAKENLLQVKSLSNVDRLAEIKDFLK